MANSEPVLQVTAADFSAEQPTSRETPSVLIFPPADQAIIMALPEEVVAALSAAVHPHQVEAVQEVQEVQEPERGGIKGSS